MDQTSTPHIKISYTMGAIGAARSNKGELMYTSHPMSKKIPVQAPCSRILMGLTSPFSFKNWGMLERKDFSLSSASLAAMAFATRSARRCFFFPISAVARESLALESYDCGVDEARAKSTKSGMLGSPFSSNSNRFSSVRSEINSSRLRAALTFPLPIMLAVISSGLIFFLGGVFVATSSTSRSNSGSSAPPPLPSCGSSDDSTPPPPSPASLGGGGGGDDDLLSFRRRRLFF
mmetsp:Transcript_9341/g.22680  ORF Transcript_9341/g.22680 Transcript_9341/m.22680 type:complete len:233 (+) Transcript_9341:145-843(+)